MTEDIYSLIKLENWNLIKDDDGQEKIEAYGELYPLTHPVNIHLKRAREALNPEWKYRHRKAAHDYLWPDEIWHYWTERRFRRLSENWTTITWAGGASSAKSNDAGKFAVLWWLENPSKRTVIIASTTLESLNARIWGYVKKYFKKIKIPIPVKYTASPTPKILLAREEGGIKNMSDTIHGMFAIAAKKGDDDEAIALWIGRHPEDGMLLILDEATDMPLSILKALPNLAAKEENFQCVAIGNSNELYDLHGTLSTPKEGWDSIDPFKDIEWETTQENGLCMFFSCYDSPAIHEEDPILRGLLGKFLITADEVRQKEIDLGKESDAFMRFVLGFWRKTSTSSIIIPPDYIERYKAQELAEWSGIYELNILAGLDPSFSTGGDKCSLQLGILGVDARGKMVLDFRGNRFLFEIPIVGNITKSVDLQIADGVIEILRHYGVRLGNLCIDANGGGRGLGETIRLRMNETQLPMRVFTTRLGNAGIHGVKGTITPDMVIMSAYDLWFAFKGFMENEQIRGLPDVTVRQLTTRLTEFGTDKKPKLESKEAYKRRIGNIFRSMARSPDEADAAAHTLQMAVRGHGFHPGQEVKLENPFMLDKMYYHHRAIMQGASMSEQDHKPGIPSANFNAGIESLVGKKLFS